MSEESPQELVESASDHIQTSNEHEQRAGELAAKAEEQLQEHVAQQLPDSYVVDVEAVYDGPGSGFVVRVYDEQVTNAVESIASAELEVDFRRSQEVVIGNELPTAANTQRDRIQDIRGIIEDLEEQFDDGAPIAEVVKRAHLVGIGQDKAEHEIETLKQQGEVYEPRTDHLRTT
ncbi:hypothetical protein EGH23_24410 [Halomicroarcula sp. F27]|uniref:MCM C-terminal domain-containing protein n=1 Tax=Haloarcula nitratireducens TaxID=2487749 RepID=A0AAW4PJ70_9EURY|nr:hypothetical protein [Halomicroarcula nitratireducens]